MIEQGCIFRHDFGPRKNHLQEGPRPVIVVQSNSLNKIEAYGNVVVVPLTTKHRASATYVKIEQSGANSLAAESWAITNQIFTISKEELGEPLGRASKTELFEIKQGLKITLALDR